MAYCHSKSGGGERQAYLRARVEFLNRRFEANSDSTSVTERSADRGFAGRFICQYDPGMEQSTCHSADNGDQVSLSAEYFH